MRQRPGGQQMAGRDTLSQYQFPFGHGSVKAKKQLLEQLSKSFPDSALEWIRSPRVQVERTRLRPDQIDWENREKWAATHEPRKVARKVRRIQQGHEKPVFAVDRPGHDDVFIADGHHHAEAYTELIGSGDGGVKEKHLKRGKFKSSDFPAFVARVPSVRGPWDEMHASQEMDSPDA
jgi:hypothetical protein